MKQLFKKNKEIPRKAIQYNQNSSTSTEVIQGKIGLKGRGKKKPICNKQVLREES